MGKKFVCKIFYEPDIVNELVWESHNMEMDNCVDLQHEARLVSGVVDFDTAVRNAAESGFLSWRDAATLQYLQDVVGDEDKAYAIRSLNKQAQKLLDCKARALRNVLQDVNHKLQQK
jgi:hypothetical protein